MPSAKSAKEYRNEGNEAYKNRKWGEAIKCYSESLKLEKRDYLVYANRSAAYLKKGEKDKAMKDATTCIKLKNTYSKGYIRKAAAYHAMKNYDAEVAVFKEGLKLCKDGESQKALKEGLESARKSRSNNSNAARAANKTRATKEAAKSKNKKAGSSENVSQFVAQTKMNLELQMAALQAQLDMVNELVKMGEEEKLDLLYTLLDKDKDGTINAKELADGMRKRNQDLSFADSIQKAVEMIAIFDDDGDAELNREEFQHFSQRMTVELGATFDEFAEFLVYQLLFSETDEDEELADEIDKEEMKKEVRQRGLLLDTLSDPRMMSLFVLFDKDGDQTVNFKEVACGLYHLTKSMEESAKATTGLLLMMDKDDTRQLGYEQFAKLILAIAAAANSTFDDVADDLTLALMNNVELSQEALQALEIANDQYIESREELKEKDEQQKVSSALSTSRINRLFELWDTSGDGTIDFEELQSGLRRYQSASGMSKEDAENAATMLMSHDADGDHALDRFEYARAMMNYAELVKIDLQELIDFMCVVSVLGENSDYEKAYSKAADVGMVKGKKKKSKKKPNKRTSLSGSANKKMPRKP